MKKSLFLLILPFLFAISGHTNTAKAFGECTEFGFSAYYDYLSDGCKCMSGYGFGTNILGKTSCVSMNQICQEKLGFMSTYDSLSGNCACMSGYVLGKDLLGNLSCTSGITYCFNKHGSFSKYDSLSNSCTCMDGYTFDDNDKCVEKQNNVYFFLKELDTNQKRALIKSNYDYKNYLIGYGVGCLDFTFERYVGKLIVLNLGTDFSVDLFDKVLLQNDDEECDITHVEKVESDYSLTTNDSTTGAIAIDPNLLSPVVLPQTNSNATTNSISTNNQNYFPDVATSNKNYKAIMYLRDKKIIQGYNNGNFGPADTLTRAQLTKILVGVKISNLADIKSYKDCFDDVKGDWSENYVCYAKSQGWISGYKDGMFKPNQIVSKVEALKILLNSQSITTSTVTNKPFDDVPTDDWSAPFVGKAKELGLLEETGNLFAGTDGETRASICENLYRLLTTSKQNNGDL